MAVLLALSVLFTVAPMPMAYAAGPAVVGVSIEPVDHLTGDPQTDASVSTHGGRIAYRVSYSCAVDVCTDTTVTLPPHGLDPAYGQFRMHTPLLGEWTAPFPGATITGTVDGGVTVSLGDLAAGSSGTFTVVYGNHRPSFYTIHNEVYPASYFPPGHQVQMSATIESENSDNPASADAAPVTWDIIVPENPTVAKLGEGSVDADTEVTYSVRMSSGCWRRAGSGHVNANGTYLCAASYTVVDHLPPQAVYVSSTDGGVYDPVAHTVTWAVSGPEAAGGISHTGGGWSATTEYHPREVTVIYPSANFPEGNGGADFVVSVTNEVSADVTYLDGSTGDAQTSYTHDVGRTTPFAKATSSTKDVTDHGTDGPIDLVRVPPDTTGMTCPPGGQDDWGRSCSPGQPVAPFPPNSYYWQIYAYNQANVPGVAVIEDVFDQAGTEVYRIEPSPAGATIEWTLDDGTTGTSTTIADAPAGRHFTHMRVTSPELAGPNLEPSGTASTPFRVRMHFRIEAGAPIGEERTNTVTSTMTYPDHPDLEPISFTRSRTIRFIETPALLPRVFARYVGAPVVEGGGQAVPGRNVTFNVRGVTDRIPGTVDITPQYAFVAPEGWTIEPGSASFPAGSVPAGVTFDYRVVTIGGVERQAVVATWPSTVAFGRNANWPTMSVVAQPTFAVAAGTTSVAHFYTADSRNTWDNTQATFEGAFQDTVDLDGDGDTGEWYASIAQNVVVSATDALNVVKEICRVDLGEPDGCDWIADPDVLVGVSPTATDIRYRVTLQNTGNTELGSVVGYDVLPHIGDTGLLASTASTARGTTVGLTLNGVADVSPGLSLAYSTSTNPCRPEVYPSAPGCEAGWAAPESGAASIRMTVDAPLAPGESRSFQYTAALDAGAADGAVACNSIAVASDRTLPAEPRNVCATTEEADLALTAPARLPLQDGRPGVLAFGVENLGGSPTSPMRVSIDLPEGLTVTDLTVDGWRCVPMGTHPEDTAVGPDELICQAVNADGTPRALGLGVPELLALPVVPDRSLADEICVTAAATGPMHDPQLANNDDEACAAVAVLALGGELVLEKTDGREVVELGDEYTYTITATNALVAEDLAAVSLVDTLPAGVAFVAASDGGTVGGQLPDGTGGTVTWPTVGLAAAGLASTDGDVTAGAPGSWVTRTVTVRVEATAAGDVVNTASASAPDPADGGRTLTAIATDIDALRRLTVEKSSSAVHPGVREGDVVTYTVTLRNTGTAAYDAASPAVLVDDLAGVLDDATFVAGSASVDTGSGAVSMADPTGATLRWSGPLDAGDDVVLTYQVAVGTGATGDRMLANAAYAADGSTECDPTWGIDERGLSCMVTLDPFAPVLDKQVMSAEQNDDGTWTIVYGLDVRNLNTADAATYDLADELRFGAGIDVVSAAIFAAPAGVPTNPWAGSGDLASAVSIPAGETHHYEIGVVADANAVAGTAAALCATGVAGGFGNLATIDLGPIGQQDAWTCVGPVEPTVAKTAAPAVQNHDGTWTVTYTVTVSNPNVAPAGGLSYLLDDVLQFPAGVSVIGVTASGPADAPVNPAFDGAGDPAILTAPDRIPAALDPTTPSLRTFTVTVVTDVPAGAIDDRSAAACAPAGTGGYTNTVTLSSGGSVLATATACTPVVEQPTPEVTKTVTSTAVDSGTGYWTVVYRVGVVNPDPSASTIYSLIDELQFAPDANVILADATSVGGAADPAWNGVTDTALATDVTLPGGAAHTYDVTVVVDPATVDPESAIADCRVDDGEDGTGLRNVVTLLSGAADPTPFAAACEPLTDPSVAKTVAGAPVQDPATGVWTLEYQVVVTNRSTSTAPSGIPYTLVDELGLPGDVAIEGVEVTGPVGATVNPAFDGASQTALATHSIGAAADESTPERHVYTVTVEFTVPGGLTASTDCDPLQGPGGLRNLVEITVGARTSADVACVDVPDAPVPGISKDVVSQHQRPDGTWELAYRITVANPDASVAARYQLTDRFALGAGMSLVGDPEVVAPAGVAVEGDWDGQSATTLAEQILLPGGGSHVYTVTAVVDAGSVRGSDPAGDCTITGGESGSGFSNVASSSTGVAQRDAIACVQAWDPGVTKTVSGEPVRQPDGSWEVSYFVTVTNPSDTAALRYALADELAFPSGTVIDDAVVTPRPGAAPTNGGWDGEDDIVVVAPGALLPPAAVHVYDVTVRATLPPDQPSVPGGWLNGATVVSSTDGAVTSVALAAADIVVPALTVTKTSDADDVVRIGEVVNYNVVLRNTGDGPFTALAPAELWDDLSGVLDDGELVAMAEVQPDTGTLSADGARLRWTGPLAPGDEVHLTYPVRVVDTGHGDHVLRNIAFAADVAGTDPPTPQPDDCIGGRCAMVQTDLPGVHIEKNVSSDAITVGEPLTYTVRLTNTGVVDLPDWDPAAFTDDLSDVLDDAVIVAGPTASSGTASLVDTELRWHGALAAGGSVEVVYTVELGGTAGDRVLRNTAVADPSLAMRWNDGECPDGEAMCAPPERAVQTETGVRALTVSKVADTGSAGAGDVVTYEVTVTNTGTANFTPSAPARIDDDMADVLDDATYRNDATATWGALARTATGLEWEGSLAVGESVTLTYSVRVADTVTGNGALTNTVWSLASSNCATGSTDGACRAVTEVLAQAATSPITSVPIPVTG